MNFNYFICIHFTFLLVSKMLTLTSDAKYGNAIQKNKLTHVQFSEWRFIKTLRLQQTCDYLNQTNKIFKTLFNK